jgi:hypothetical protein
MPPGSFRLGVQVRTNAMVMARPRASGSRAPAGGGGCSSGRVKAPTWWWVRACRSGPGRGEMSRHLRGAGPPGGQQSDLASVTDPRTGRNAAAAGAGGAGRGRDRGPQPGRGAEGQPLEAFTSMTRGSSSRSGPAAGRRYGITSGGRLAHLLKDHRVGVPPIRHAPRGGTHCSVTAAVRPRAT